ncbi:hypothetical protein ACIQ8G_26795 [Streptomyces sp. NPDC094154]|uniref:hypothetical protein n=1 Tax=Streptomyces sp. NPDC094154 TaxID=3366059 RepID=UPI0037F8962F
MADDLAGHGRGQTAQEAFDEARMLADWYSSSAPKNTRSVAPAPLPTTPVTGDTVPFDPHGRAPMSQRATDHAALVLVYSFGSLPVGAAISLVLWRLSSVSPTTLTIVGVGTVGVITSIGVAARMIGRAVRDGASALPTPTVNHYTGPNYVQHNQLHTETKWFGTTNNELPSNRE